MTLICAPASSFPHPHTSISALYIVSVMLLHFLLFTTIYLNHRVSSVYYTRLIQYSNKSSLSTLPAAIRGAPPSMYEKAGQIFRFSTMRRFIAYICSQGLKVLTFSNALFSMIMLGEKARIVIHHVHHPTLQQGATYRCATGSS